MAHLARIMFLAHSLLQVVTLLAVFPKMVLAENPENITEVCSPHLLPCEGDACVLATRDVDTRGGAAVCTCPSTGYQDVKYCYTERPAWSQDHQKYMECKWGSGKPRDNSTRSDTVVTPSRCDMGIYAFCPEEGPESGGTDVMIWGHGFAHQASDMDVSFTGFKCTIISSNSTFIHCLTSSVLGTNARGSYLRLRIELPQSGCKLEERSAFTYKYDPSVTDMQPLQSFLGGGTIITVTGNNLNSTAKVMMQFTTIFKGKKELTVSECIKKNTTLVLCPAPRINLNIADLEAASSSTSGSRRRRQLPGSGPFRRKRDSAGDQKTEGLLASPDFSVYGGLKLDGVLGGQVFSAWKVYKNPIVEEFPGEFLNYRPSWPDYKEVVHINGENLLSGVTAADYSVTIGSEPCRELLFGPSSIECTPPKEPPTPPPGALQRNGDPALVVKVGNLEYVVGYIHYDLDLWSHSKVRYAIIGVLSAGIPVIVCIIILIGVRCHYRRKRMKKEREAYDDDEMFPTKSNGNFTGSAKNDYIVGDYLHPKASLIQAISPELRTQVQSCLLHEGRVDKTHIKSRGDHGAIYRGWLLDEKGSRMVSADIKTFKHDNVPFRDLKTFLQDAVKLKGFDHDHVQRLLAITVSTNMPQAIVPSSEYGDLKSFLYKQRQRQEGEEVEEEEDVFSHTHPDIQELTLDQMVKLGRDISAGMTFLSEKGFIHEDLAARNCVLDKDLVVKVGDATLSRDIYELDYWRPGEKLELRPVKWMAPESLESSFFSVKSDVWSFGVTLWEIFSLGMTPYTDVANADVREHLRQGHRLTKPDSMPVSLYKEVTHCWAKEPNKRPQFQALLTCLEEFGGSSAGGSLNEGYSTSYNNIISEVGARASATSAELISSYIEEETRKRNSAESKRDSKESKEGSGEVDENEVELTEIKRDSDVSGNVSESGDSASSKEPDGINPRDSAENTDEIF